MFETDTVLFINDGKYHLPVWKKMAVCCTLIFLFGGLYVTLSKMDYRKECITQVFNDSQVNDKLNIPSSDDCGSTTPLKRNLETQTTNISWTSRDDWEARPPLKKILTTQPAGYVVISHTATSSCSGLLPCCKMIKAMQRYQMINRGYDDIGYNFLIGGNKLPIYEGRGWDVQPDDFYNYKNNSVSIAIIGNFTLEHPTDLELENLEELIQYGVENGKIDRNYKLLGHKQFQSTDSPGQLLYDVIKKWDHWANI